MCGRDECDHQRSPLGNARWAGAGNLRRSLCSQLLLPAAVVVAGEPEGSSRRVSEMINHVWQQ